MIKSGYDFRKRSDACMIFDDTPSMTKQSFKESCDVNNILRKYTKNGINPFVITEDAKFGDFTNVPSYEDALHLVMAAQEHFEQIPAKVRERFSNDPGRLIEYLADPDNRQEAIKYGLIVQKKDNDEKKSEDSGEKKAEGQGA